jgi:multicomponent K+:H+ antiporter subunit D
MLASVMLSVMAQPVARYVQAAATQLQDRAAYADAVLSSQGGAAANTARPYTGILAPAAPASAPGARP